MIWQALVLGSGTSLIFDLWTCRNKHQPQPDWMKVDERLRTGGIHEAAHNLLDISEYLFGKLKEIPLLTEVSEYVLKGGLHGDYKRGLASQASSGSAVRR